MNNEEIKRYWEELNEMYGTCFDMPDKLEFDEDQFRHDIAMGQTFDAAMQKDMA